MFSYYNQTIEFDINQIQEAKMHGVSGISYNQSNPKLIIKTKFIFARINLSKG